MEIKSRLSDGELAVELIGRLDTSTAPELEKALTLDEVQKLDIDLAGIEYLSSAGLRVLLSAHKTMQKKGGLVLRNLRPIVKEVFDITGFTDIFEIV